MYRCEISTAGSRGQESKTARPKDLVVLEEKNMKNSYSFHEFDKCSLFAQQKGSQPSIDLVNRGYLSDEW